MRGIESRGSLRLRFCVLFIAIRLVLVTVQRSEVLEQESINILQSRGRLLVPLADGGFRCCFSGIAPFELAALSTAKIMAGSVERFALWMSATTQKPASGGADMKLRSLISDPAKHIRKRFLQLFSNKSFPHISRSNAQVTVNIDFQLKNQVPLQMNFTDLLNNGSPLDDLNEPPLTYDTPLSQYNSDGFHFEATDTAEAESDQEMSCEPNKKKSQKQAQRTGNFSAEEDKLLIAAWLNTSLDPINGSDQKKSQFWKRISQYFQEHKSWPDERTEKSLTNRWTRISSSVSKFSGHYAAVERLRKSGYTEADKIQEAKTIYKCKEDHQFGFDHCWTLLRFQQKWMVEHQKFLTSKNSKGPSSKNRISINLEDENGSDVNEPAPLKRPIGRKAAKEATKKQKYNGQGGDGENESSKLLSELQEFRARRLESDRIKAESLKKLIEIEQKQVALREKEIESQARSEEAKMALREKEIEIQARSEEAKIMALDTRSMDPLEAEYIIGRKREILAKRNDKNGNE